MNTPVNFELAKFLKEKEFNEVTDLIYMTNHTSEVLFENINGLKHLDGNNPFVSAPTIAEVVMWLYKKYDIWIQANISRYGIFYCNILKKENTRSLDNPISWEMQVQLNDFNSPTEAYESAIQYCLNNLINQ